MNAASPGVIALFQPNDFYPTLDAYLEEIAEAMRSEYEAIVGAGFLLQIDAPDLGMGRHTMYRNASTADYLKSAARHVEVLNHALRNLPPDRLRMHICWDQFFPLLLEKAAPGCIIVTDLARIGIAAHLADMMKEAGIVKELIQVQVCRGYDLAGDIALRPVNPIFMVIGKC